MNTDSGLIHACRFDGRGAACLLGWEDVRRHDPAGGCLWVHLDHAQPSARGWLVGEAALEPIVAEALLAEETRPRLSLFDKGALVILRGVNLNPGADPEDMVSIRMWIENGRVITVRMRKLMAVQDLRVSLENGQGPANAGEFLVHIIRRLLERMEPVVQALDDELDTLEEEVVEKPSSGLRAALGVIRRRAIALRRYIAPQRDVLARLAAEEMPLIEPRSRARLRESADRITRYLEDLDALRERAAVINDELATRLSEQMNTTMYSLALVATIFLPLGLLTGLLGINVGGIPGADNPLAFIEVCLLLAILAGGIVWFFRRSRLM